MSGTKGKGPIVDPGLCRCCGCTKKCRLLNLEYAWLGQKEVYSDMFMDTFGLLLCNLDGEPGERLICATCVTRLRDACAFRRQVLCCEEQLLQTSICVHGTDNEPKDSMKREGDLKAEITGSTCKGLRDDVSDASALDADTHDADDNDAGVDDTDVPDIERDNSVKDDDDDVLAKLVLSSKTKKNKAAKKENLKKDRARKEMKVKMKMMSEQLKQLQQIDQPPIEQHVDRQVKRAVDNEYRAFRNTTTIVENSFVCPFDTSFSDYYCLYCRKVFTDPNKLREHTLTHDPTVFKDCVTNKKMPQIDISRIDCRLCLERIDDIDILKGHLSTVHGMVLHPVSNEFLKFRLTVNNLTCIECDSAFSYFHALKKHMAEHFGTCICDMCGAHYFDERMLILHQKTHQRIEESFPCKDCGKIFKSKHSRNIHETRTHKKEPVYPCPKCDEVFFSYSLRYRHMITVHGEERTFQCDHCDRTYDSRKSLREHNRRFHLKIFKHQCDMCEKRFYLPSRLREHMASHTGERNFRCEYCGKSYPRLRGLKVHMQTHSNEKKYRCIVCDAAFTANANLRNHVKKQHQVCI